MRKTMTFEQIVATYRIEHVDLANWIARRWVRPEEDADGFLFDDVDQARLDLIRDLRDRMLVNDESLALILSLLDQLYSTRRALKSIEAVITSLPEPIRSQLDTRLRDRPR